jgi:hypothetical protein
VSPFTARQIADILGNLRDNMLTDPVVLAERKKINAKYSVLKGTKRWWSAEELKQEGNLWALKQHPEGADLVPGFTWCARESRAWWITENLL